MIERALFDKNREMLLILAKALDFSWATTMALLFLGAKDHRVTAKELRDTETEFGRLKIETSRSVLEFYQSRKNAGSAASGLERRPTSCASDGDDADIGNDGSIRRPTASARFQVRRRHPRETRGIQYAAALQMITGACAYWVARSSRR